MMSFFNLCHLNGPPPLPQISLLLSSMLHMSCDNLETHFTGDTNCWRYWPRTTRLSLKSSETWCQRMWRGDGILLKKKKKGSQKGSKIVEATRWSRWTVCRHFQPCRGRQAWGMLLIHWSRSMGDRRQTWTCEWKLPGCDWHMDSVRSTVKYMWTFMNCARWATFK